MQCQSQRDSYSLAFSSCPASFSARSARARCTAATTVSGATRSMLSDLMRDRAPRSIVTAPLRTPQRVATKLRCHAGAGAGVSGRGDAVSARRCGRCCGGSSGGCRGAAATAPPPSPSAPQQQLQQQQQRQQQQHPHGTASHRTSASFAAPSTAGAAMATATASSSPIAVTAVRRAPGFASTRSTVPAPSARAWAHATGRATRAMRAGGGRKRCRVP